MVSGEYDMNTPGGRLNTFRPLDLESGEPVHTYEWAELIGIGKDVLSYVLRNTKSPGLPIVNKIDEWLLSKGYGDEALRWWRLGGPLSVRPTIQQNEKKDLRGRRALRLKKSRNHDLSEGWRPWGQASSF